MSSVSVDLNNVITRRKSGDSWTKIAADHAMPESTLRNRLHRAGLLTRGAARGAIASAASAAVAIVAPVQTVVPVATAPMVAPIAAQNGKPFSAPSWYPLLRYAMGAERGASLFGPRGCGKSTAIRQLSADLNRPTITLQCAANMQIDSLLGSWTSKNGTLNFIDGPLTQAVRSGAWLLAEEANVIHPGVWSVVNTLTDATGEPLRLPNGEVVQQSPDFRLVLIYNEGYSGTREVNAALKDRLMPIYCGYLPAAEEAELLEKITGAPTADCKRVQDVASMIRAANLRFDLSPRSLTRWIRLVRDAGMSWGDAFARSIIDLVGPPELAAPQRACLEEIAKNTIEQW